VGENLPFLRCVGENLPFFLKVHVLGENFPFFEKMHVLEEKFPFLKGCIFWEIFSHPNKKVPRNEKKSQILIKPAGHK
jgi:hypothetical protein